MNKSDSNIDTYVSNKMYRTGDVFQRHFICYTKMSEFFSHLIVEKFSN